MVLVLGAALAGPGRSPDAEPGPPARKVTVAEGVVLQDSRADVRSRTIRIGRIEQHSGRRGFLRSPLLQATVLRDVEVFEDGVFVTRRDVVRLPAHAIGVREAPDLSELAGLLDGLEVATR